MVAHDQLIYPTVDLFIYDLAEGLGESGTTIDKNRENFLKRIYGENLNSEILKQTKKVEEKDNNYLPLSVTDFEYDLYFLEIAKLLNKKYLRLFSFYFHTWIQQRRIPSYYIKFLGTEDGYYYPVKLGDTYCLQIDCSKEDKPQPLTILKDIKNLIQEQVNTCQGTLGQTWLIWGMLTSPEQDAVETAKSCYQNINLFSDQNWKRDLKQTGQFLGANFYELFKPPSEQSKNCDHVHLIICLFDWNAQLNNIQILVQQLYPKFIRLFLYQNKIIWAYWQSRILKFNLKKAYSTIKKLVEQLPKKVNKPELNLKELQIELADTLKVFSVYSQQLSNLEEQQSTIKTNLKNYQNQTKVIAKLKENYNSKATLEFFDFFSSYAEEKYLEQIASDLRSLQSGFKLLENAIKTIEGIINIEQTKSTNKLSLTVGVVGIALAASGVTASVLSAQPEAKRPQSYTDFSFITSPTFVISSLPILIVLIGWMGLKLRKCKIFK